MCANVLPITAIERVARRKRLTVRLKGAPDLSLTPDIALQFGLRPGVALSSSRLEALQGAQAREDAMALALRLVAYRPRSEKELRDRLRQRGMQAGLVDATVVRLKELRLIDDRAFAASWVESRNHSSPRSRRLLAAELRQKGVARDAVDSATAGVDEGDAAYRAASGRARKLAGRRFEEVRRKVTDLLLRRGFSYEVAGEAVKRLWDELALERDAELEDEV